ncbi:MAG: MGMT family protein [Thermoleophilia bacterium]
MAVVEPAALAALCTRIPAGRWTSYGDLADALGLPGRSRAVARVLADHHDVPNAHRVLLASGRVSPGWGVVGGGRPETARRLLESEGVRFSRAGVADPARRWHPS